MYLSRVALDVRRRSTMAALANPQKFHGAVESSFAGERRRRLWRLDTLGEKRYLLILSADIPDLEGIVLQFGTGEPAETKDYTPLLQRITPSSVWHFRLTANPTKSNANPKVPAQRGTVQAHITVEHQKQWLFQRAQKHGFVLAMDGFTVTNSHWMHFYKGNSRRPVSLLSVTYEGTLMVENAALFQQVLTQGMGRGKAYGLGMMTVMGRSLSNA